jgi:uncharacterized protein (TIGR02757 family)
MNRSQLKLFLDEKVKEYNKPSFIKDDPVSVPRRFSKKQDIEIAGLFSAVFSWGNRKTIINKSNEILQLMDNSPHDFILNHKETDLKKLLSFRHRTFNATDALYFIYFLKNYYKKNYSLENAFSNGMKITDDTVENGLIHFHKLFFSLEDSPQRTRKHVSTPEKNSSCKRLNMFLRWMVRNDNCGVDFGIWKKIKPAQLVCPLDLHVDRIARRYRLIKSKNTNWKTAIELTNNLRKLDANDPVKYDFALFGIGVLEKFLFAK